MDVAAGVEVVGGVGLWAIAGALISESGMIRAAIRAAQRRVRRDKPDAVRDGFIRAFRTHVAEQSDHHIRQN
ncbi:hypothetical protein GCM10023096_36490 [Nonomuraea ferruginea]